MSRKTPSSSFLLPIHENGRKYEEGGAAIEEAKAAAVAAAAAAAAATLVAIRFGETGTAKKIRPTSQFGCHQIRPLPKPGV